MPNNQLPNLNDIELPPDIGFWPIAWGWWLLVAIIVAAIVIGIIWWRRNRYRFFAKKLLVEYYKNYQQSHSAIDYVQQLAQLLRQIAITAYGIESVSQLQGESWALFLNSKTKKIIFDEQSCAYITQAPFCDDHYFETHFNNINVVQLHNLALRWIRQHR